MSLQKLAHRVLRNVQCPLVCDSDCCPFELPPKRTIVFAFSKQRQAFLLFFLTPNSAVRGFVR